jgi:hypothetical protein
MKNLSRWCAFAALLVFTCATANAGGGNSVPVMTPFTVKLDQAVSADKAANGTPFTATLKQPVEIDGHVIIPVGASVGGVVNKDPQSTQMELNSIFVNGRLHRITTEPISIRAKTPLRAGSTLTFHLVLSLNLAK